jgi:hypothetical protein
MSRMTILNPFHAQEARLYVKLRTTNFNATSFSSGPRLRIYIQQEISLRNGLVLVRFAASKTLCGHKAVGVETASLLYSDCSGFLLLLQLWNLLEQPRDASRN